ncbi:SDR family oxidoreductase [Streptomyces sp. DSM 44915]|uniref:SDR family oxidoreductase n=1 Tax=Streptomyces chisholmiae TaxID=3075540 RepID=A0ABU2JLL5_9ACTN|nr:SDR family oxidoreductase [Streptomyces sp. DSM 44915]MDT0265877.1 SDR family oxidoreductase [Streptomyces sp. DSM 44915]
MVTGGSRGIGLEIARTLVARGDRVCVTGRDAERLAAAVAELGPHAMGVAGKAHDPEHQAEVVERVLAAWGRLDHLVNNAGSNPAFGPLTDVEPALLAKVFEINVLSAFGFARRAWSAWQHQHGGTVVNIASVAGLGASPFLGAYGVSKAALVNLTEQLAHELAPLVRVNAVAPAVVKTRFASALYEGNEERLAAGYPLGRLGVPSDVAGVVAFLSSPAAAWLTGQTLVVDGGVGLTAGTG